jgi:hypothetical protein
MHRVSFPGTQNYEQYTAQFELDAEDVSPELLDGCNLLEQMFVFDTLVCYQGLLFQYTKGYIDKKDLDGQTKRLFSTLTDKLRGVVKNILKDGREVTGDGRRDTVKDKKSVDNVKKGSTRQRKSTDTGAAT